MLDTNVLLHDPQALFKFEDNDVVIPITVIEEIDRFKKDQSETGRNARHVSRYLDGLRKKSHLFEGVEMESGGKLRVLLFTEASLNRLPPELKDDRGDNRILDITRQFTARLVDLGNDLGEDIAAFFTQPYMDLYLGMAWITAGTHVFNAACPSNTNL